MDEAMRAAGSERTSPSSRLLWLGILAPPIAWGTQLLISYGVEEIVCSPGSRSTSVFGLPAIPATIAVSLACLGVSLLAVAVAHLAHRRLKNEPPPNRPGWMAFVGIVSGAIFGLLIATQTIPLFVLPLCESSL